MLVYKVVYGRGAGIKKVDVDAKWKGDNTLMFNDWRGAVSKDVYKADAHNLDGVLVHSWCKTYDEALSKFGLYLWERVEQAQVAVAKAENRYSRLMCMKEEDIQVEVEE